MYIVISKPKRRSVKAGVVHCMFISLMMFELDREPFRDRTSKCKVHAFDQRQCMCTLFAFQFDFDEAQWM